MPAITRWSWKKRHYMALRDIVLAEAAGIGAAARMTAELDVNAALPDLAAAEGWTEPVVDDSHAFEIEVAATPWSRPPCENKVTGLLSPMTAH